MAEKVQLWALALASCDSATFKQLSLFGGKIQNIATVSHSGLSLQIPYAQNYYAKNVTNLDACEVAITYTHPGYNDVINTVVWLPTPDHWTGRFLGNGGGGWSAMVEDNATLAWAASEGFAVVTTDGGHIGGAGPEEWALLSPGNLNWNLLTDFASTALDDAATLGKAVTKAYYGKAPDHSYWNGCSQGGRQGYMMAQRYPEQYDGILATAPAVGYGQIFMQFYWAQAVMNDLGEYPSPCEFEAISVAAVKACDPIDGLEDNIVLSSNECDFDPSTLVGHEHVCPSLNSSATISAAAATVAKETWKGSTSPSGELLWPGLDKSASLAIHARTQCFNGTCSSNPAPLPIGWMKYFLAHDPDFDTTNISTVQFDRLFRESVERYSSVIGTESTDLTDFKKAGGKLLTWNGVADLTLGRRYIENYVKKVYARDPNASDYYRYFEAPSVDHCGIGPSGYYPGDALKSLIEWVEKGVAPETLEAKVRNQGFKKANLCLWPKKMVYLGGNGTDASSFGCK
ncbi:feruloyl esterase-like protein B precursor [Phaeosphaeria sp. MPI-PUGE-AT-0046c]|nr:feruloyl esterase-like protein B precursor [Phaeosphaeria sp. MPI-PUGE-AT-0046c]